MRRTLWIAVLVLAAPCGFSLAADELPDVGQLAVQGRYSEALEMVDRLLARDPGRPAARFAKGLVLARAGRVEAAEQIFVDLTRQHPEYPEPFNNLAVIYAERGDYERSAEVLKQALRTHSSYRTAYENLTKVYGRLASKAYDRALGQESVAPATGPSLQLLSDLDSSATDAAQMVPGVVVQEPLATLSEQLPSASDVEPEPAAADETAEPAFDAAAVVAMVNAWAEAWSEQQVADYLGFYSSRFTPSDGISRSRWAGERRQRIERPRSIQVTLESVAVRPLEDGRAQVRFLQSYRSDSFEDRIVKILDLVQEAGAWKILHENSSPE